LAITFGEKGTENMPNLLIMTFGQPKIGNQAFIDDFHSWIPKNNYYRYDNHLDIVTVLPPNASYIGLWRENCTDLVEDNKPTTIFRRIGKLFDVKDNIIKTLWKDEHHAIDVLDMDVLLKRHTLDT